MTKKLAQTYSWSGMRLLRKKTKESFKDHQVYVLLQRKYFWIHAELFGSTILNLHFYYTPLRTAARLLEAAEKEWIDRLIQICPPLTRKQR